MKKLVLNSLKKENIFKTLEVVCFSFGIISILFSLLLIFVFGGGVDPDSAKTQRLAIFIGLWAPSLIGIACYLKNNNIFNR
jgi:hypothetical protein